ncbi:hypothetical protein D3C76_1205650 [compost metagenome]
MSLAERRPAPGSVSVPMSLSETLPRSNAMVLFLPVVPSTEQASLLISPVKLIWPPPAGVAASAEPLAAITDIARNARENLFIWSSIDIRGCCIGMPDKLYSSAC